MHDCLLSCVPNGLDRVGINRNRNSNLLYLRESKQPISALCSFKNCRAEFISNTYIERSNAHKFSKKIVVSRRFRPMQSLSLQRLYDPHYIAPCKLRRRFAIHMLLNIVMFGIINTKLHLLVPEIDNTKLETR